MGLEQKAEGRARDAKLNHRIYRTVHQRRRVLEETVDTLQSRGIYQPNPVPETVGDVFISELHGLINQRHFDQFDGNTIEDIDFSDALGIVQEKTITSIVCHSQAVKKSNFLASA